MPVMAKQPASKEKLNEKIAEAQALLEAGKDPSVLGTFIGAKAIEQFIESQAAARAAERLHHERLEEDRRKHVVPPYDIEALQRPRDTTTLYEQARERVDAVAAYAHSKEERDVHLTEELRAARALTLGLANEVKDQLLGHYRGPDTEISEVTRYQKREWQGWGQFLLESGYARPMVEKRQYNHIANGWLLEFPATANATGSVVLCEDGRLLALKGNIENEEERKIDGKPVKIPLHGRPVDYKGPGRRISYGNEPGRSRFIEEAPVPDLAAPPP